MSIFSGNAVRSQHKARFVYLFVAAVVAAAWFGSLELRGLFIPDEGRYAEIPREMLVGGDWVTPRQNDLKYFEKPPLQYWLTALTYRCFGEDEWTARLPATLLGFLALLMVALTAYRLWGLHAGSMAGAVLGGSWAYFLSSQYLTLDMTLTACLTFALCAFLLAQQASPGSRRWIWVTWVSAALAVLSKGLIGVVLPAATLGIYIAIRREWGILGRIRLLAGSALFLLIAVPWFVVVQRRNPEFFNFFFIQEHFQRFAEAGHHREGVWWYYLPILLIGFMPWTPLLLKAGIDCLAAPKSRRQGFSPALLCVVWAAVVVIFFSLSHSKLPAYVIPAFPAIALAVASRMQPGRMNGLTWAAGGTWLLGLLLLVLTPSLPAAARFSALGGDTVKQLVWIYCACATLAASGLAALLLARRQLFYPAVVVLLFGTFGFWQLIFGFLGAIDESLSSERLIERLTDDDLNWPFHPELPFFSVGQYDESVPFYLGRTMTLVDQVGELGPGIAAEPQKAIPALGAFKAIWLAQPGQAYAIMKPPELALFRQWGLPMTEVVSDRRLVVVSRIPEPLPGNRRPERRFHR